MIELDANALAMIQTTAVNSMLPKILPIPGGPPHISVLAKPDGKYELLEAQRLPRAHRVDTLNSLIELAEGANRGECGGNKSVLWLGNSSVTLVLDDVSGRGRATLPLDTTPQFAALVSGHAAKWRTQPDFVRFMRLELADAVPVDVRLLEIVRNIKWNTGSVGESNVRLGKESMGRSINAEVLGTEALPDTITLNVRIFQTSDLEMRKPIICAVDVDPQTQQFRLVPLPMECQNAQAAVTDEIERALNAGTNVPCYRGIVSWH